MEEQSPLFRVHSLSTPYLNKESTLYAVVDERNGEAFFIGERFEIELLISALQAALSGIHGKPITYDFASGWLNIQEMCLKAHYFDPYKYPYETKKEKKRLAHRIRQALQQQRIREGVKTSTGRWRVHQNNFFEWLNEK
ncbi:MAG: hypothetical protein ACPGWR_07885 [Ardenticatenaceae bacterium]